MTYSQVAYHVLWRHANSNERASQEFQPHGLSLPLMNYSREAYNSLLPDPAEAYQAYICVTQPQLIQPMRERWQTALQLIQPPV